MRTWWLKPTYRLLEIILLITVVQLEPYLGVGGTYKN